MLPAHTIPPPRWVRRWVIYAIAPVYAVVVAILATRLGAWAAGVGLLGLIVAGAWISLNAERRERAARLRHLRSREPRPLAEQAEALLRVHGLSPTTEVLRLVVDRWKEAAGFLGVDPRLLRPEDDLALDYRPARSPLAASMALDDFEYELEVRLSRERLRENMAPGARCPGCGYDLSGLEGDRCPECGRTVFRLRTLGDYLLFVARLVPPPSAGA